MWRLLTLVFLMGLPTTAASGAWPQEKGALFLAYSSSISAGFTTRYETGHSIYTEYGLTRRLTVGFDGYLGPAGKASEAYIFMRIPVGKTNKPARMAMTFALGQKNIPNPWGPEVKQTQAKLGFSWGRGLKKGWLAIDAFAIIAVNKEIPTFAPAFTGHFNSHFKADFTWGMKPSERLMLIWQLQTGIPADGENYVKFSPSVVWSIGKSSNTKIEIGLVKGLIGDETKSLKVGFWRSF